MSHVAPAPSSPVLTKHRILSLDWVRGLMLIASVGVNSLIITPAWFDHAEWEGVHPIDVIFPIFVTLSGCGLAFALGRRVTVRPIVRRFIVLMLFGLLYNAIMAWSLSVATWRITGVLQLYAVLVAVIALLHLLTKTWQGWAVITAVLAFAHTALLTVYGTGCPGNELTRACNPSGPLDSLLFGTSHIYRLGEAGHDPEGLVAILGAIVTASAGATIGHLLRATTATARETGRGPEAAIRPLLLAAVGFLALAALVTYTLPLALGVHLPVMKRLWTAPYALILAAGVSVLLLIGHLLLDRPDTPPLLRQAAYPLISLGRNSLLVYFGSHVVMSLLNRQWGENPSLAARCADLFPSAAIGQAVWSLGVLAFWIGLATFLHRRRIYLRP